MVADSTHNQKATRQFSRLNSREKRRTIMYVQDFVGNIMPPEVTVTPFGGVSGFVIASSTGGCMGSLKTRLNADTPAQSGYSATVYSHYHSVGDVMAFRWRHYGDASHEYWMGLFGTINTRHESSGQFAVGFKDDKFALLTTKEGVHNVHWCSVAPVDGKLYEARLELKSGLLELQLGDENGDLIETRTKTDRISEPGTVPMYFGAKVVKAAAGVELNFPIDWWKHEKMRGPKSQIPKLIA